jgi:PPOX class probable F420-dependent enzyme
MTLLDLTRSDDRHTSSRLSTEPIIWLGTVRPNGWPHNVPVWFTWDDPMMLIFSMPSTAKARDVRRAPGVSLALDSAGNGQDVVLAEGHARPADPTDPQVGRLAEPFREKYAPSLGSVSFDQWRSTFSLPLLVQVDQIIAWMRTVDEVAYRVVPVA